MKEQWRGVPTYEEVYQVSDRGRVRRIQDRYDSIAPDRKVCRILKPRWSGNGYPAVCLSWKGDKQYQYVHRLVAAAFVDRVDDERVEVNHKNGDKADNRACNLEWVTTAENHKHAARIGLTPRGEQNAAAKLTEKQARHIRALCAAGKYTFQELGEMYGVSGATIGDLVRAETWAHLGQPVTARAPHRGNMKVSPAQVQDIRRAYQRGKTRLVDVAQQFGISKSQVSNIVRYASWPNV